MTQKNPFKIAIASGKGGTGKTLVSTNLACYISQTQNCLLVDLDVEEPNDSLFFKEVLTPITLQYKMIPQWDESKCTLCGECSTNCKFHAVLQLGTFVAVFKELCHSCYACSELCATDALPMQMHPIGELHKLEKGYLTLVESRLNIEEEQAVPLIHKTHQWVDNNYSDTAIQIFDCPPGTSCPVVAATQNADFVILVTEPTPFGLNDLRLAVETMRHLKKQFGVVINRDGVGDESVVQYCQSEQIPILTRITFDKQIALHYSKGDIVYKKVDHVAKSMSEIMENIPFNN
jgi:MinD superfamily P-loop ATPase